MLPKSYKSFDLLSQQEVQDNKGQQQSDNLSQSSISSSLSSSNSSDPSLDNGTFKKTNIYNPKAIEAASCLNFGPFIDYFKGSNKQHTTVVNSDISQNIVMKFHYLQKPVAFYHPEQSLHQRNAVTTSKQLQYVRGSVNDYIDKKLISQILQKQDDISEAASIVREGNKSIIIEQLSVFIYGHNNTLKSYSLKKLNALKSNQSEPILRTYKQKCKTLHIFPQKILQVKKFPYSLSICIAIRTKSHIYLYSIEHNMILDTLKFTTIRNNVTTQRQSDQQEQEKQIKINRFVYDYQITAMEIIQRNQSMRGGDQKKIIYFALYSYSVAICAIYAWEINIGYMGGILEEMRKKDGELCQINRYMKRKNGKIKKFTRKRLLYRITETQNYIISLKSINQRQMLLAFPNKIVILDLKDSVIVEELLTKNQSFCHNPLKRNRFYGMQLLNCVQYCSSEFLVSDNRYLSIFDLRYINTNHPLTQYSHRCQQSPPSILQISYHKSPFIICHSTSNKLSSALLLQLQLSSNNFHNSHTITQKSQIFHTLSLPKNTNKQNKNNNNYLLNNQYFTRFPLPLSMQTNNSLLSSINNPSILFTSNVLYQGVYPISLSAGFHRQQDCMYILQVDSQEGISTQYFNQDQQTRKYHRYDINMNMKNDMGVLEDDLSLKWIEDKILEPYYKKQQEIQDQQQQEEQSDDEDLSKFAMKHIKKQTDHKNQNPTYNKNINYLTLTKFYNKIKQLSTQQHSLQSQQSDNKKISQTFDNSFPRYTQHQQQQQAQQIKINKPPNQIYNFKSQKHKFYQLNTIQENNKSSDRIINKQFIKQLQKQWEI